MSFTSFNGWHSEHTNELLETHNLIDYYWVQRQSSSMVPGRTLKLTRTFRSTRADLITWSDLRTLELSGVRDSLSTDYLSSCLYPILLVRRGVSVWRLKKHLDFKELRGRMHRSSELLEEDHGNQYWTPSKIFGLHGFYSSRRLPVMMDIFQMLCSIDMRNWRIELTMGLGVFLVSNTHSLHHTPHAYTRSYVRPMTTKSICPT